MRADFSNEFGSQARNKFNPIWAMSGQWNLHESVLREVSWIDALALRTSFGHQGNVPSTAIRLVVEKGAYNSNYQEYGSTIYSYPNISLKWEKTTTFNAGIDFSLFNNKINGSFEFYTRYTKDVYITEQVSEVNGVSSQMVNGGSIRNNGIDVFLNFKPIDNMTVVNGELKGFRWNFDPQIDQVINRIIDNATASRGKSLKTDDQILYTDYLNGSIPVRGYPINAFFPTPSQASVLPTAVPIMRSMPSNIHR
ncbi:MAG: TonB-dependent receptor [Rikenellaceae bacterium]|nr:TonB-dependent receptor [Rikenellaceae bacterium]